MLAPYVNFIKKAFMVIIVLVVVFTLFSSFRKIDSKPEVANAIVRKEAAEAKRKSMYTAMAASQDRLYSENDVMARRFDRWSMCVTIGELCSSSPNESQEYKKDSLSFRLAGLVALPLRHPPSSFIYLARDTLENVGFVPKTYATGIGFYALSSFQPVWKAFRDLSYLIIVLIIVAVGFMVMFGIGGGGKTAVSLETALPKLVVALLTISFSYAIAGLFIDIMYIAIILVVSLLGTQAGLDSMQQGALSSQIINGTPSNLLLMMLVNVGNSDSNYWNLATSFYNILPSYMQFTLDGVGNMLLGGWIGSSLTVKKVPQIGISGISQNPSQFFSSWGRIASGIVAKMSGVKALVEEGQGTGGGLLGASTYAWIINLVITLVVQIFLGPIVTKTILTFILILSMIIVVFRIFFALLFVYIDIILTIMFAPISLMFEAIPGQNAFVKWMKGLAVNLMVFPLFAAIMLVVRIIMNNAGQTTMWTPPFVSVISDQLSIQMIVGAVILYSIPQILKMFRKKLGAQSMLSDLNLGVGALFVGATPIIGGATTIFKTSGIGKAMTDRFIGTRPLQKVAEESGKQIADAGSSMVPKS